MAFIDEFLGRIHKLVFLADKTADRILRQNADLTFSQFVLLNVAHKCHTVSQADVAKSLGVTEALISRQVQELLRKELISKETHPTKQKGYILKLTKAGKQEYTRTLKLLTKYFPALDTLVPKKEHPTILKYLDSMIYQFPQTIKKQ